MKNKLIFGRNLTYNLRSYLNQKKDKTKKGPLNTFEEREKTRFILKAFKEDQKENNEKYKKMHEENKIFTESYKLFDKIRTKKKYNEVTFKELIAEYKQKNYKIPDLTSKHNLFEESPLLLNKSKIFDYYKYNQYRDDINLNSTKVKLNKSEKCKKYMDKIEGVIRDHNLFHNNKKDTRYDYHMKIKTLLTEQDEKKYNNNYSEFKSFSEYKNEINKLESDIEDIKNGIERMEEERINSLSAKRSNSLKKVTISYSSKYQQPIRKNTFQRQKTMVIRHESSNLQLAKKFNLDFLKEKEEINNNKTAIKSRNNLKITFQLINDNNNNKNIVNKNENNNKKNNVNKNNNNNNKNNNNKSNSEHKLNNYLNYSNDSNEENNETNKNNYFNSTRSTFQTTGFSFRNNTKIKSRNQIIPNLKTGMTENSKIKYSKKRYSMTGLKLLSDRNKKNSFISPETFRKYENKSKFLEHFMKVPFKKLNKKFINTITTIYCEKFLEYDDEKIENLINEEGNSKNLLIKINDLEKIIFKPDFENKIISTNNQIRKRLASMEKLDNKIRKFDRELIRNVVNVITDK